MDGKTHHLDDLHFLVKGDGEVLQLCKLWDVDRGQGGVRWPDSKSKWAAYQESDGGGQRVRRECVETPWWCRTEGVG